MAPDTRSGRRRVPASQQEGVVAEQHQDPTERRQDAKTEAAGVPPAPAEPQGIELTDDELDKVAGGAGMQHEISKSAIGNLRG